MWLRAAGGTSRFWLDDWLRHQRRDDYWKHGSVCEDYAAIECPVYAVGGWADGYSNAIPRMLERAASAREGRSSARGRTNIRTSRMPGPQIGFLQEALRWWDHWLKGIETGIMDEPMLRVWMQDPVPPATWYAERPGRWAASRAGLAHGSHLSSGRSPRVRLRVPVLQPAEEQLSICSPQTVGAAAGKWCAYGLDADQPGDQREEGGGSLLFDTPPFEQPLEILGAPVLHLDVAADRPDAFVAVTLSEVLPDGAATRISYGLLNLTHRDGHEDLKPLEPGKPLQGAHPAERVRPADRRRQPAAARDLIRLLADRLAFAGEGNTLRHNGDEHT